MRIAFTHNVQRNAIEAEAEFDSPRTVAAIADALRGLGHEVEPIDVAGPLSSVIARIEAFRPDLAFNTAEGTEGRFREAFFPALFERMRIPFTGSDALACALTLDKRLTKEILARHGVPIARDALVERPDDIDAAVAAGLRWPLIVKPNCEGSSMGIRADAVVEDVAAFRARCADLLLRFPGGVLVEEYVAGRDVVVPFLEGASPSTHGVLEPAGYEFDEARIGARKFPIYDFELKTSANDAVTVIVPVPLPAAVRTRLMDTAHVVFRALRIRDLGRIDFRVRADGSFCFLEINALPSLEPGAAIFRSAELVGLETEPSVFGCVVGTAAARYGIGGVSG